MATGMLSDPGARKGLLLVSPPFLFALVMLAIPLGAVVLLSFWSRQGFTLDTTFTLANYQEAVGHPLYRLLLGRSLLVSGLVTLVTVLLAYPIAYFVSFKVDPSRKALWLLLITIPFWTSYLIRVVLWKVILGYNGVINSALMWVGVIDEPLQAINYNMGAVVITLAHSYAPFAILPIFVALEKIDRSFLEASLDLGENKFMTFIRVTLPLSMTGIVASVLIVFIPTVGDFVTPELLGGPGGKLMANMIQSMFLGINKPTLGAALAVISMVSVGVVSLIFVLLCSRWLGGRQ
ncbi:ABC transporter permease [Ketogulonicigenium vulgare]|uniref:Spermidine/putrescine ABC transporter, permease protein n=1 Tax=Ketogulonicigenium vulgare (strain WSH-001) TaxID=759362 RepID=F9Y6Y3_KETVW|nr:ABC transporter permease [Ketogulonicigenium vulgare]ADO42815.1 ABC spermidine/putrescine transporter, inner membrane subunit [Ketogulonicigenium vulgare Y25]AEM41000.1 Spermidine/putrescine ABC transporter, permease protein [Ketogulonicigenium vulgare WSH-001]ALJ81151.1 spermidine/putrescine ABC transporter permease [Ketogulonicigenium vulgare]ANW33899.1 spermidine/putrescine ABC transporter permease [Ketogulonicigenium vulgare]AOZ54727.1 spermidine/putrescine ABC transporter inner membran